MPRNTYRFPSIRYDLFSYFQSNLILRTLVKEHLNVSPLSQQVNSLQNAECEEH